MAFEDSWILDRQLEAISRAAQSESADVWVMAPMIALASETEWFTEKVRAHGLPTAGVMVEVPGAALNAEQILQVADFASIGTNDLAQYTLAADRNNENVAGLYNPVDPAVLRLIRTVVGAASREEVAVNVCGEMSGEPVYAPLLVGMGLRQLSATPRKIPEIKRVIRSLTVPDAERVAQEALRMETAREVASYLREQLRRFLPEAAD